MEEKAFYNLLSLANRFEDISPNKHIEIIYSTDKKEITLNIIHTKTNTKLKSITYEHHAFRDIEELENMLEMFIDKEEE